MLLAAAGPWTNQACAQPYAYDVLKVADYEAHTFVAPTSDRHKQAGARTAQINVTYDGFTDEAQRAFAYAVSIWETHISSPVVIDLKATFAPLDATTLGAAGPNLIAFETGDSAPSEITRNTWYATPLAEAIVGADLTDGGPDIVATFNSDFDNWYYGLDDAPSGTFSLATVVLHEIGHGLGFVDSFGYDDGVEDADNPDECPNAGEGFGCWGLALPDQGLPFPGYPYVFDRLIEDANEIELLNTTVYPNPSRELADALQSDALFLDGMSIRLVNNDVPADLYAPSNFEPGSSVAHLDEQAFPPGTINSLMTPKLARSETIFTPGPLVCATFLDLGWPLGPDCLALLPQPTTTLAADVQGDDVVLTIRTNGGQLSRVDVQQQFFDDAFETIETIPGSDIPGGTQDFTIPLDDLPPGQYTFRLLEVGVNGASTIGPDVQVAIPLSDDFVLSEVFPNPVTRRGTLFLQVADDQTVKAEMFDAVGRRVAQLFDARVEAQERRRIPVPATGLSSGVYFIVVVGDSFRATRTAVVVQ